MLATAKLEADLMQVNSVTHLAWIPHQKVNAMPANTETILKGHFLIRLIRHDGTIETVTAGTKWVEENFKASIIGTVQRVAYETK
jgi:hypothetical protein